MKTLPMLSREWGESLDTLRGFVRVAPALKGIGSFLGSQRVFDAEEAARIKQAFDARPRRVVQRT